jgi:ethanolamine utilization protein EutA
MELDDPITPVAIFAPWRGSATFARIDAFCRGVAVAMVSKLSHGHALILVGDGDVGGLIGIHFREELKLKSPVVSIDGLELKDFDFIDIGTILESSGAVPVVIKSLVFPSSAALGREAIATPRQTNEAIASD